MMIFESRAHAAQLLAAKLHQYADAQPLILAIPRGGVPVAKVIADQLGGELDLVLSRKLGAPFNSEYAIGAVAESGEYYIAPYAERIGATKEYLDVEIEKQMDLMRRRRAQYQQILRPISPKGRVVIIVDDGLATGATMTVALDSVRAQQPKLLICAIPVAPAGALLELRLHCDELVCLHASDNFQAVGQFYRKFDQVDDQEVIKMLGEGPHED